MAPRRNAKPLTDCSIMTNALDSSNRFNMVTVAWFVAGALLAVYGCVELLDGFSLGGLGMLMLGSGLCVLGLVRWKVKGQAARTST